MRESSDIRVQIFGAEYQIVTDSDAAHTREVARYVDQKMREIAKAMSLRSVSQIAVLTAVNIADELFRELESSRKVDRSACEQADALSHSMSRLRLSE